MGQRPEDRAGRKVGHGSGPHGHLDGLIQAGEGHLVASVIFANLEAGPMMLTGEETAADWGAAIAVMRTTTARSALTTVLNSARDASSSTP
jgi:hypothetical protein